MVVSEKEIDFPRGGGASEKITSTRKSDRHIKDRDENQLFGNGKKRINTNRGSGIERKKKKTEQAETSGVWTKTISMDLLTDGILGIGIVREVKEDQVQLETADSCRVNLPATQVGKKFTELLKCDQITTEIAFIVGQMVPFRVIKHFVNNGKKGYEYPTVSCDPTKVNGHLIPARLVPGLVIHSIVESIEEKGAVLDIGLQSVKGFLPKEKQPIKGLVEGQPLIVRVEFQSSRIIRVTSFIEQENLSVEACEKLQMNHLMPGTIIGCEPELEQSPAGVFVSLGNGVRGFVTRRHLPPRLRTDTSKLGRSLRCVVMFCQQNSNLLVLSAHPDITAVSKPEKRAVFQGYEIGDRIKCTVFDVLPAKFLVCFALPVGDDAKAPLITALSSKSYLDKAEDCESVYKIGSEHECRIMDYRLAERCLVVATRKDILKQKIVSYKEGTPGELVEAKVTMVHSKGVQVLVYGMVKGFIPHLHTSDKAVATEKMFAVDKIVKCRVLYVDDAGKQLYLTARPSLVNAKGVRINSYDESLINKISIGIVVNILPSGGLLVLFYNSVKGLIQATDAKKLGENVKQNQALEVRVVSVDAGQRKMMLSIVDETLEKSDIVAKPEIKKKCSDDTVDDEKILTKTKLGIRTKTLKAFNIYTATVIGQWVSESERESGKLSAQLELPGGNIGRLHVSELPCSYLTECSSPLTDFLLKNLHKSVKVKVIGYSNITKDGSKIRIADVTMSEDKLSEKRLKAKILGFKMKYKVGDSVRCFALPNENASDKQLRMEVSPIWSAVIPRESISGDLKVSNPTSKSAVVDLALKVGEMRFGLVMAINKKIRGHCRGVLSLSLDPAAASKKFEPGQRLTGRVVKVDLSPLSVTFQLASGRQAQLCPTAIATKYERVHTLIKKFHIGEIFHLYGLRCDLEPRRYYVATEGRYEAYTKIHKSDTPIDENTNERMLIIDRHRILQGMVLDGFVVSHVADAVFVELGPGIRGRMRKSPNCKFALIPVNTIVKVRVTKVDEQFRIALAFNSIVYQPTVELSSGTKRTSNKLEDNDSAKERKNNEEEEPTLKTAISDPGFDWSNEGFRPEDLALVGKLGEHEIPRETNASESNDKEETVNEVNDSFSNHVKEERDIDKEKKLSYIEMIRGEEIEPETDEDYALLLRRNPNSAELWIRYISFFLKKDDLIKARATAERALTAINCREEVELFNIWTAYLNMEVAYGDADSTHAVFERACGNADSFKMHKQMTAIYAAEKKTQEADKIFDDMIRKFRSSSDEVWTLYGEHFMNTGRMEKARDLMQRSLTSIPKQRHTQLISRFAQMEFRMGDIERGRTLFESLVNAYPKKTDIWLVYADLAVKYSGIELARQVLERACELPLSLHKLRPLFRKWMEAEQRFGDEQSQKLVRAKAEKCLQLDDTV